METFWLTVSTPVVTKIQFFFPLFFLTNFILSFSGQLGLGDRENRLKPEVMMRNEHGAKVFCGSLHSFLLKKDSSLFAFGRNEHGQLSLPQIAVNSYPVPTLVMKNERIRKVFCGVNTSFLLSDNASLFACGDNQYNKLGIRKRESIFNFEFVTGETKQVFSMGTFTVVLKENGQVFVFGWLECDQLSGNPGELERKLEVGEPVAVIVGSDPVSVEWTTDTHKEFDQEFQESVLCFLLCMKSNIPNHLKLPKPLLSIILNLSL